VLGVFGDPIVLCVVKEHLGVRAGYTGKGFFEWR
jgi:hypothetical protein